MLTNQMRRLETQMSQQSGAGSQVSSNQMQRIHNAIQTAQAELRRIQSRLQNTQSSGPRFDKLDGEVSAITNSEAMLEKRLLQEMKRIEAQLRRLQNMFNNQNSGTGSEQSNGHIGLSLDSDYYHPKSNENTNGNMNNHAFNLPDDLFVSSNQQADDIYEADRDYFSSAQPASADNDTEFKVIQAQFDKNSFLAKIIAIAFGSFLGLVLLVGVVFGCIINALLCLRRKNKGTKAESTILTT